VPLVRIDLLEGKSEQYRAQVGDILYQTLVDVLNVPEHDRFQVITEHTKASLPFDLEYLGIHRSDDCIFFQITLNSGRSTELKQRFYKALADHLHEGVKIRKEDVLINFVEVPKENWSFGNGEAQYVTLQNRSKMTPVAGSGGERARFLRQLVDFSLIAGILEASKCKY
jgi:4-oxalocrotonate tautomerase